MKQISGAKAIALMRAIRHDKDKHFTMHHLTWNLATNKSEGLRVVEQCRLRKALPGDIFKTDSDLYLPYTDLEDNEPKQCFKILIRFVAFPPDFQLIKVNWYI